MTAPVGGNGSGERVFIRLGPPPEEPNQFVVEGAPQSYSPEVRARLEVEAKEIIGGYAMIEAKVIAFCFQLVHYANLRRANEMQRFLRGH